MTANLQNLSDSLSSLTVIELAELSKILQEKWGVSAAVAISGASASVAPQVEEKTKFEVFLSDIGANKINVIKEVRAITGLGLTEAKQLVDSAPKTIKSDLSKEEAEEIKKKLEAAGAKIELK